MKSYKHLYSLSLKDKEKLHFAAHSHHPWPDCTYEAHQAYWRDSSKLLDQKWDHIFGKIIPELQENIANILNLSHPQMIAIAPNTHEFVVRLFSCFDHKIKVLTTDSEFHSFRRQLQRMVEADRVEATIVPVEPYETFKDRWLNEVSRNYDMIFTSQVYFNSGFTCPELKDWIDKVPSTAMVVVDGYHAFCAIPTDLKPFENRIFYLAGGYKYAQSGEGVCFLVCPLESHQRPINTGWFASFETLNRTQGAVEYSSSGMRFWGSTFDASGCYRMNSVFAQLKKEGLTISDIHSRVEELKKYFLEKLSSANLLQFDPQNVIRSFEGIPESHFLTFRTKEANHIEEILAKNNIVVDSRGDRLRFGFGLYHDLNDIDHLIIRLQEAMR